MTIPLDRRWLASLGLLAACNGEPAGTGTGTGTGTAAGDDAPCVSDRDCPQDGDCGSYCSPTGVCQEWWECGYDDYGYDPGPYYQCRTDDDCDEGEVCRYYGCIVPPECYVDTDCGPGQACDSDVCIDAGAALPACAAIPLNAAKFDLPHPPSGLALGDLDGDGDLDLHAALPEVAAIQLAFNDGTGAFTLGELLDVGPPQSSLHLGAGDLDGDGDLDLAVARSDSSDLLLVFGQDTVYTPGPSLPASASPRDVTVADRDGDGDLDLTSTVGDGTFLATWLNDGLGNFAPETSFGGFLRPQLVPSLGADVIPDLVGVPDPGATQLKVYRGTASATWNFDSEIDLVGGAWTQAFPGVLGDTAAPELIVLGTANGPGLVRAYQGTGDHEWGNWRNYLLSTALAGGLVTDVDADALDDLVLATGAPTVAVLFGDGQGGLSCERLHTVKAATAREVLVAGDLDGDPDIELVAGSRDAPTVTVLLTL